MRNSTPSAATLPWMMALPVKRSRFTSLHPRHQHLNVEVAFDRVRAFDMDSRPVGPRSVIHADFQTSPVWNHAKHWGSGRAGVYLGKYLKGIGRTPLADTWNERRDAYHGSGHLLASGAIREYLVTQYCKARGIESAIVGCEGLLLRPLDRRLRTVSEKTKRQLQVRTIAPVDRRFQAISVKNADFARYTNFVWLLDHFVPKAHFFGRFFHLLELYARPPDQRDIAANEVTPDSIVGAMTEAIARGIDHFTSFFEHGIYWCSFDNNFTLDGRFLDLEVPLVTGVPCFASMVRADHALPPVMRRPFIGLELLSYCAQIRSSVSLLSTQLDWIARTLPSSSVEREFVLEFCDALKRHLVRRSLAFARPQLARYVVSMIERFNVMTPAERGVLERHLATEQGKVTAQVGTFLSRRLPVDPPPLEPGVSYRLYAALANTALDSRRLPINEHAVSFNKRVGEADACVHLPTLFEMLKR